MEPSPQEKAVLDRILQLLSERAESYETGVQTTVSCRTTSGWMNSLTKMDFVRRGEKPSPPLKHVYANVVILRRLLSPDQVSTLLKQLSAENKLDTGDSIGSIPLETRLSIGGKSRWSHSEWSHWPADVFTFEPPSGQSWPSDEPLISSDQPYYPSFEHLLSDFFAIRSQGWTNYLRGQVVIVLPDFRGRISKLTIALTSLRAELECPFLAPADVVVKLFAESSLGRLAQKTIQPDSSIVEVDLTDKPSLVSLALLSKVTGETLHEKTFREGVTWREPGVVVEDSQPEIEQFLLTGESETVEFKEKLDKGRPEKIAKAVAAFANTKGGTVVFGVDDDHNVVGCDVRGMPDTITNIIRSYCDPPPAFSIKVVARDSKELLLLQVSESPSTVHFVKDLGLLIRANGSNRAPTSHEFQLLLQRRGIAETGLPHFPWR
jgi:hypothetical protein